MPRTCAVISCVNASFSSSTSSATLLTASEPASTSTSICSTTAASGSGATSSRIDQRLVVLLLFLPSILPPPSDIRCPTPIDSLWPKDARGGLGSPNDSRLEDEAIAAESVGPPNDCRDEGQTPPSSAVLRESPPVGWSEEGSGLGAPSSDSRPPARPMDGRYTADARRDRPMDDRRRN